MQKETFKQTPIIALFASLTAIGAFIRIPVPFVPFTLQLFFCLLSGLLLGARRGPLSQILYVGMGLVGIPVFTAGGGLGYVFQPTFGYLLGFIACAWITGNITHARPHPTALRLFFASLAGLGAVYALGIPWLYMIYNFWLHDPRSIAWAVYYGFAICFGGDLLVVAIAVAAARRLLPLLRKNSAAVMIGFQYEGDS